MARSRVSSLLLEARCESIGENPFFLNSKPLTRHSVLDGRLPMHDLNFFIWALIYGLIAIVMFGVPCAVIFKKVGYHPALAVLIFIPLVNWLLLLFLAFSTWPIERQLALLRLDSGKVNPRYVEGALAAAIASFAKGDLDTAKAAAQRIAVLGREAQGFLDSLPPDA